MDWRGVYEHRYFVLDGCRLSYRLEEFGSEKKSGTVTSIDPWKGSDSNDASKGFCFSVWLLEGGSWTLRAETREIYEGWLKVLVNMPMKKSPKISQNKTVDVGETAAGNGVGGSTPPPNAPLADRIAHDVDTETVTPSTAHEQSCVTGAPLLSSMIEKQAAWCGRWNPRYIELYEGRQIACRTSADQNERQRFVVLSADYSPLVTQASQLLFTISNGERFWVRFGSVDECQKWKKTIQTLLRKECSWHWFSLDEDDAAKSLRLRQATSGEYDLLCVQYACSTLIPSIDPSRWCPRILVYGGVERSCKQAFSPQARAFLPQTDAQWVCSRLCSLELAGPHLVHEWHPTAFEENPHALVRPLPRYGATLTYLPQLKSSMTQFINVMLLGGRCVGGYRPPETEVWRLQTTISSASEVGGSQWLRHDVKPSALPHLFFHDAVYIPFVAAPDEEGKETPETQGCVLIAGGFNVDEECQSECYALLWTSTEEDGSPSTITPVIHRVGTLPEPRAFHKMVVIDDGTIVLAGGRTTEGSAPAAQVLTLNCEDVRRASLKATATPKSSDTRVCNAAAEKETDWCSISDDDDRANAVEATEDTPWRGVIWEAPTNGAIIPPDLDDVTAAAVSGSNRVVIMDQQYQPCTTVKLFVIDFLNSSKHTSETGDRHEECRPFSATRHARCTQILFGVGAIPSRIVGVRVQIYDGYLYVIGACNGKTSKEGENVLDTPLRILLE